MGQRLPYRLCLAYVGLALHSGRFAIATERYEKCQFRTLA